MFFCCVLQHAYCFAVYAFLLQGTLNKPRQGLEVYRCVYYVMVIRAPLVTLVSLLCDVIFAAFLILFYCKYNSKAFVKPRNKRTQIENGGRNACIAVYFIN